MGRFLMWIARRGAVGGTAKWAAAAYRRVRSLHPELEADGEVFLKMIEYRYQALGEARRRDRVLHLAKGHGRAGLRMLVAIVLGEEAGFFDNPPETQMQFFKIIEGELVKSGIPTSVIRGA
ncbi:MAG: hypothetical protein KJ058_02000 [Thermoanaerobaculia bacterium]|nr:hypothetical protein [Thermoanaerobaculia bacterium]